MKIYKVNWIGCGIECKAVPVMANDAKVFDYDKDGNPMYYSESEEQYYIIK